MSIINAVKTFFSIASAIEPHIVKIIDYQKALGAAEVEKQKLKEENNRLKTHILVTTILAAIFFIISVTLLIFLLSSRCSIF